LLATTAGAAINDGQVWALEERLWLDGPSLYGRLLDRVMLMA
jgi:hypothetical protein